MPTDRRPFAACLFALVLLLAGWMPSGPIRAETLLQFDFAPLEDGRPAPTPRLEITDLFGGGPVPVTAAPTEGSAARLTATLPDSLFDGPYARLRVAVGGLQLAADDSKGGQDIRFAFDIVIRRALVRDGTVTVQIPVVTSSRRGAMKPYLTMPDLPEDLPGRFFLAQQWMSLYQAGPEAVAEAPQAFALHRLLARAVADFAIATATARPGAALIIPAPELAQAIALYWASMPSGLQTHLAAYADARRMLWLDVAAVEDMLRSARRGGPEAPARCQAARAHVGFFERRLPDPAEAASVDALFPVPGTLAGYLAGRQADILFACTRMRL
jgi:hypothetical protein